MRTRVTLNFGLGVIVAGTLTACRPAAESDRGADVRAGAGQPTTTVEVAAAEGEVNRNGADGARSQPQHAKPGPAARAVIDPSVAKIDGKNSVGVRAAPRRAGRAGDWAKQARAQLVRPTDFAKLTAELKRKQALAEGFDEAGLLAELEKRALTGDANAALTLGLMLRYGDGATDQAQGAAMINAAAKAGKARAMAEWGRILLADDTNVDAANQADGWLRRAWAAGESEGAFLLASAQRLGLLEPAAGDDSTAMLVATAELGNESARRLLIAAAKREQLADVANEQVLRWTEDLANAGDVHAMYSMAMQAHNAGNHDAAVVWFQRAAANGDTNAILRLATYGSQDQQVQLAAINHLRVQLSDPSTASDHARDTLAFILAYQPDTEANRTEILGLLREAAAQHNSKAALAARMIAGGSTPRAAMVAMIGMDSATAYARDVQETFDAVTEVDPETGTPLNAIPKPLEAPTPMYPIELSASKTDGTVTVQFFVDETGAVRDPQVIASDHPAFSAAALEAISRWRFIPGIKDGRAVTTRTQVDFPFKLQ